MPHPSAEPPIPLAARDVVLRPVAQSDYELVRMAELAGGLGPVWRHRGSTPSPETYVHQLWQNVLAQYLVIDHRDPSPPLGIVVAYNASFLDGHCFVGFARFPHSRSVVKFGQGVVVFVDHLFHTWPFRKLYGETTERTLAQFASGIGRLMEIEARLDSHTYDRGDYVDQLTLSCTRERWKIEGRRYVDWATRSR